MLVGFVLGVAVTFLGSIISYIVLTMLMDIGSLESVRVAEANRPLTTTLGETAHLEDDSEELSYSTHNGPSVPKLQAYNQQTPSPQNQVISEPARNLVKKLLIAKIRLAGITGITDISDSWLEGYINAKHTLLFRSAAVEPKT